MREFTVVDLTAQCQVRQTLRYAYNLLEKIPGASELIGSCSGQIWRNPDEFEYSFPQTEQRLKIRWRSTGQTAGIATLRENQRVLSISLLVSGLDADTDACTLQTFQTHIVRELHDTGFEPAFGLVELADRPLLATMSLFTPDQQDDHWAFALIDRCFAAAYFRKLNLV